MLITACQAIFLTPETPVSYAKARSFLSFEGAALLFQVLLGARAVTVWEPMVLQPWMALLGPKNLLIFSPHLYG